MRLYRRGQSRHWTLDVRHRGKRYVVSSRISNQKQANEWARDFIARLHRNEYRPNEDDITFEQLVELARNDYVINARRSLPSLELVIKRLSRAFSSMAAVSITHERIERYKAQRIQDGVAKATVNADLSALSLMFRLALEQGLVSRKPRIKFLNVQDNARQGFVSQGDYLAIRAGLPERLADLTDFLWWTGLRLGTAQRLEWKDIHEHSIRIRSETTKTGEAHEIPLVGELAALIARAAIYRDLRCPYVFHGRRGKQIHRQWTSIVWKRAANAAGLRGVIVHDLRRSFVRNMRLAGMPEDTIMGFTGHRTRGIFSRYNIVRVEEKAAALERMSEFLAGQSKKPRVRKM